MSKKQLKSGSPPGAMGPSSFGQGGSPVPQDVDHVLALYTQGRYAEATVIAQAMTARYPMFAFGWKVLGVLLCQMGKPVEAIAPMQKAATLSRNDDEAYFNLGNVLKEAGRLDEAAASYRKALAIKPGSAEAYGNLGAVLQDLGRLEEAVASYRRALDLKPDSAGMHFNLANTLSDLGRRDDAVVSYRKALAIAPDFAEAHFNLGTALQHLTRPDEAIESYKRALALNPGLAEAHFSMGTALKEIGRSDEAIACYHRALAIRPDYAEAHFNLGNARNDEGKPDEAIESYRQALKIRPDYAEACFSVSATLHRLGRLEDAVASYRDALKIKPDYAEACVNLGNVLKELDRLDEAVESYRRAIEIRPGYAEAQNNCGAALQAMGQMDAAAACYLKALEIKPEYAEAHFNVGTVLQDQGRFVDAAACYTRAVELKPDYAEAHDNRGALLLELGQTDSAVACFRRALEIRPAFAGARSNLLFTLAYGGLAASLGLLAEARQWQVQSVPVALAAAARKREFHRSPRSGRRLRVGYVSGDYRQHAVSNFIEPLFRLHDRSRIELFAYAVSPKRDELTDRLQALTEHWQDVAGMSDEALRAQIEADAIDVLIDLSGHTGHNRLGVFALRAAPVQSHYLGYFATTGLAEMDYWLGDPVLFPESENANYCETIWRLPRVWVSYQGRDDAPLPSWTPKEDGVVCLGSFNNLKKITPATMNLWAKILHAMPNARLLLKTPELGGAQNRKRIEGAMAGRGIAAERLELLGETKDWIAHMALYDRLDIALDPIGAVGGGTTTCDALWMGLPVITLVGQGMAQRMTASMLDAIGHREWIADSESAYEAKVIALAGDVEHRRAMRLTQRDQMRSSPLCDAAGLARALEDAFESMFDHWRESVAADREGTCNGSAISC